MFFCISKFIFLTEECTTEGNDKVNRIDFPVFLAIVERKSIKPETEKSICDAFRTFDVKGKGTITSKKLKQIMTGMGEKLSDAEVDEMIKQAECCNGDGKVKYEKFIKMMMTES